MTILSAYICISAHEFRIQNFHMENPRHDHLSYSGGSVCIFYIFFISENLIISLLLLHSSALR